MSLYSDLGVTALALLTRFGVAAVLNKRAAGAYNSATGTVTQVTTQYAIQVFIAGRKERKNEAAAVARELEMVIGASGLAVAVDNEDTITVGGKTYKVVDPGPVAPTGEVVVYLATVAS